MDATRKTPALYNPRNWWFVTFFLGPLPTVICYAHNIKALGDPKKGRAVLIGGLLFAIGLIVFSFLFEPWGFLAALVLQLFATWYAARLAKTQIPIYDQKVKTEATFVKKSMLPIIVVFVGVQLLLLFILPEVIATYIARKYPATVGGDFAFAPRVDTLPKVDMPTSTAEQPAEAQSLQLRMTLPAGYDIDKSVSSVPGTADYTILPPTPNSDDLWHATLVPLAAMEAFDERCPPGDCMRDALRYPTAEVWRNDREKVGTRIGDRRYFITDKRVDGDLGYHRWYVTYVDDVRVVFVSGWFNNARSGSWEDGTLASFVIQGVE